MQAYRSDPAYRERPDVHNELDWIGRRLNQPIRVALAGTLKAGKSTLVNALVGEDIAPTDATEATRIVTWFRNGATPKVTANHRGGRRSNVPIARDPGDRGLTFDFASLDPDDVVDLDVEWPAAELVDTTIIDTPGTSSLSRDVSERTLRLLVPEDGVPRVDAVVFLLRTLNADRHRAAQADRHPRRRLVGRARRDRRGVAGRRDRRRPHRRDAVGQGRRHPVHRGDGQDGHLPGRRPGVGAARADRADVAAERVRRAGEARRGGRRRAGQGDAVGGPVRPRGQPSLPVDAATRAALLERFGMFGIRISIAVLRAGYHRLGRAGRRAARAQRADRAARRHRPAVRAAVGSAEGAHRAAVAAAVRRGQPDLRHARTSSPTSNRCSPTPTRSRSCGC